MDSGGTELLHTNGANGEALTCAPRGAKAIAYPGRRRREGGARATSGSLRPLAAGQMEALRQALDALAEESTLDKLLGRVLGVMSERLGAQGVSLWLRDGSSDLPVFHLSFQRGRIRTRPDANHPVMENPAYWRENPIGQEMLRTKRAVVCEDVERDGRVAPYRDYLLAQGTRTLLAVPLLVAGRVIGLISIRCARPRRYRAEEIELAQAIAHQATLAIELTRAAEQGRKSAVLQERNRLARDIHDTLAQSFIGIIVQMEAAEDAAVRGATCEATNHLRRAAKLAREGLTEARRSVRALRPHALEEGSLQAALEALLQQMTPGLRLRGELAVSGKPRQLPLELEESLLRIGQEALTNTLRHSHANRCRLRLVFREDQVRFEVHDNGRGFDITTTKDGVGLWGMKERVARLGGQMLIESAARQGTRILVTVPDPPHRRSARA